MSVGMILLTAVSILVFFGVTQRVLDKMHLTDRMALLLIALMFFGTLIPNVVLGSVSISLGGAVIPVGICIYLFVKADTNRERVRAVTGSLISAAAVYAASALMPDEPEAIVIDPLYITGLIGGVVAYLLGRSRRNAFICGVMGVLLADIAAALVNWASGINQQLVLGGGGVFDTMIVSGLIGVILTEGIGELIERISRGTSSPAASTVHNPVKRRER